MTAITPLMPKDKPYSAYNREERHLAAILFMLLNHGDNARRLLEKAGCGDWPTTREDFGIYFEYANLRDLWHDLGKGADANIRKQTLLLDFLQSLGVASCLTRLRGHDVTTAEGISAFNAFFTTDRSVSRDHIVSPARWSINVFAAPERGLTDTEVGHLCRFKWAFNAKPDIVIHTDRDHALCLELKLESGESTYTGSAVETAALKARGLYVDRKGPTFEARQTEVQRFVLEQVLGLKARFLFVTPAAGRGAGGDDRHMSWKTLFDLLDKPACMPFVDAAISRASAPA